MKKILFELGKKEAPWSEEQIDSFIDKTQDDIRRAKAELNGGVELDDISTADIIENGIVTETSEDYIEVQYMGEKFNVVAMHESERE